MNSNKLNSKEYEDLDGLDLVRGIRDRQFSALEVMDCAIAKAESLNHKLNAISWQTYEQAREQAQYLDNNLDKIDAPLAGVPFLFKDISAVKGLPQSCHSRLFSDEIATSNAAIVDRFVDAGLISLGKSNTPELCLTVTTESVFAGACHSPWNLNHSTGGSSGGAAAAVASRIVPIAHATDGGGSIRIPASCCGVFGLKPSKGLTPVEAKLAASWSGMSVGHVVSRSVRDSAAVLDAIKLEQPQLYPLPPGQNSFLANLTDVSDLRIAIQREHPLGAKVHPDVSASLEVTADLCRQLGFQVHDEAPVINYELLADCTSKIINIHVAQTIFPQLEKRGLDLDTELLEEGTRRMAKRGAEMNATDYLTAADEIKAISRQMETFHDHFDILVSPVISQPPAPLGWLDMNSDDVKTYIRRFLSYSGFCSLFNATGQPSMSIPLHQTDDQLPIGVMFSAKWGADLELLQLAYQLEQEVDWNSRRPQEM